MRCSVCGKEMDQTSLGVFRCTNCGHAISDTGWSSSNCDIPMPHGFGEQKGWICPVCGQGVAPWVDFCPCQGSELKITYGTSTGIDNEELNRLFELNNKRVDEMISFQEKYGGQI